jgi:hypothetical protein
MQKGRGLESHQPLAEAAPGAASAFRREDQLGPTSGAIQPLHPVLTSMQRRLIYYSWRARLLP